MATDKRKTADKITFVEGIDNYSDELRRWIAAPPIRELIGVFQLPRDELYGRSLEEQLAAIGKPHLMPIYHTAETAQIDQSQSTRPDGIAAAGGFTSAVRDQYGKVRPIIFLQSETEGATSQVTDACVRHLVLIHELGHAHDIVEQVNYNHSVPSVNIVAAEVYAHKYAINTCLRRYYRVGLGQYLGSLQRGLAIDCEVIRRAAEQALAAFDTQQLAKFTDWKNLNEGAIARQLQKQGRADQIIAQNRKRERK